MPVGGVERDERVDERLAHAPATGVGEQRLGHALADHPAVEALGQVKGRSDHVRIRAGGDEARHGNGRAGQGAEQACLAHHVMRGRCERHARRAAQDPGRAAAADEEGLVGVAGADALDGERLARLQAHLRTLRVEPWLEPRRVAQQAGQIVRHAGRLARRALPVQDCCGNDAG